MNTARMQSMASKMGTIVSAVPTKTARASEGFLPICVWMFSMTTVPIIDEDADRQRHAAQGHQVDALPGDEQADEGAHQRQRNGEHDHDHAAPIAQEQQHHQAGQHGADGRLLHHAADRSGHVRRLIELQFQLAVLGQQRSRMSSMLFFNCVATVSVEASAVFRIGM